MADYPGTRGGKHRSEGIHNVRLNGVTLLSRTTMGELIILFYCLWWSGDSKEGTGFRSKNEYAMIRFDVQASEDSPRSLVFEMIRPDSSCVTPCPLLIGLVADLKPLFDNYNTKQLYVAITADYNNTKEGVSES